MPEFDSVYGYNKKVEWHDGCSKFLCTTGIVFAGYSKRMLKIWAIKICLYLIFSMWSICHMHLG